MAVIISCSCTQEIRNLMTEKHISPSKALVRGVMEMLKDPYVSDGVEKIEHESKLSKMERCIQTMQLTIEQLEEEKKNVLDNEKSRRA